MEEKINQYINDNEIFWLKDLRAYLHIEGTGDIKSVEYDRCSTLIKKLKREGIIQCCHVKGSERQYIVVNPK